VALGWSSRGVDRQALWKSIRAALLHDMGQFVREQPLSGRSAWRKSIFAEHDVPSDGIGIGSNGGGGFARRAVGVNSDPAEVVTESPLHMSARRGVQGPPWL
jgi:hypothetical protein